jgi:hypothetical protein
MGSIRDTIIKVENKTLGISKIPKRKWFNVEYRSKIEKEGMPDSTILS